MIRTPGKFVPNCNNRSSKNLFWLTKFKPIYRCMNGDVLRKWANNGLTPALTELNRRDKIRDKNQVRKQRYDEKLQAKRLNSSKKK